MTVCSTTALRKYLTQHSNLGQPSREKAVSTTRAHAEGETIINSGRYRRPLFKSSLDSSSSYTTRAGVGEPCSAPLSQAWLRETAPPPRKPTRATAVLYHPFWAYPDFWIESDSSQAREHFWQFLKNFGLARPERP